MTDCCLCVCFRPRTYKRLIKDVFQSNYQYRNELTLQHFSKGKYERLIQYMVNYPSKLSLILMKLESKFVKFYLRREISQLLLVIEIMKGVIQDYSKRSLQHLLETHLLFFINESLQTKEIVLLQAITLLLKECIKHQVFYNYNTFVGLATTSQSLQQGRGGHFNEDERITTQKKSKKELISLPYTKDEHYDFILYILYLCNNIIHQQKLQKLKELNEKEIELQSSLKTKKPLNSDTDDYNRVEKEEEEKISEEEEGREDRSNDDFHDFSTVTSNFPLNDETDALTCLGLTMIITIFGLFRSQGNNVTSSSSTPSPTTNLYLNHIHNTNNKYFYIILQTIIKLLIFITPTIDKQSIYTAFPKLTNNEMMNKIFQETRKLLQQQPRQQHQGNSNGSTNNTSDSAAFDTLESPEANNNITVTVSFLIWKIIKLYFHYQTIHESSLLYDQMIFTICNTFYQCSIPFNSSLFLRLQCFIYKSYQSSYYHSNHQQHHQTFKGMSGNTVPPILFFRIESLLCKFLINTIYTKNHHSSDSFILKRNYLEQKNAIEKSYKKKNKSSGEGGNVIDDPLIRIQLLQLQYKYYYQQYETIPTIVQLTTELNDFQSFLFDGSELFQRQIQQHFHFLQDSLSFLFLYLNYFLKVSPYQEKSQSHATTTTTDINATSSSSSAAPIATTATSRNHIDSLIQFNYFIQIILSYLMKTNDNYFYSKDLLKKNNEFFTTNTNSNHTATPEGGSKDAAIGGKKEKNDEDNVFLSSIRRSFHYRNGDQGSGALAEGGGSTGAPVSSKGFLSSYNKYLSTSNRTTSQDSVHDDEITRIIDEEGLLRSSRSADSATGQRKPFQQKNKKKYELILDEDEDDDKNDPNEGSEVVNISRSLDLTTFTTEPSIKTEDNNKDIKKEKTEKQLKHEEILDNIIFLIYEIMKTFTQHSLYQFQLNANITMVLDIVLQKTVSIEKALFLHQITPSMPVVDGGMMLNPIVGRGRAGSSNALKRTVSSAGLSLMSHSKDYRKHYQLQYFYYYSFSLLELILSNISINYSSIIIFSLEEAARNSRLHDPSSEITTPTTSSLLMTPTMMMSLESLLKSFEEMECFQQILLFIMKVMTLFSVLMMNNHFPDAIVQQIILHQESIPYNASTLTSSSSFKSSSLLTREQRAIYQKQILKFINEMTSSITVHEQMAEHRGLNSMPATAYFTLTDGAVNEVKGGNKGVISEKLYEFLFQRLLFYPYSINEFHSFLSIIFNHLMNLSSDYYIPKLVFYWNFHIYLTLLIGENCLITTITMFHKILSLLPILENNLIQKNFLYYYIIQYFIFISQLIYDDSLSSFLKQSYLSQLSYMNIIKENIGIEPLLSSSSAASSRKQEGLSLMILLKYTRTFYYNAHRVPVPPKVRNVMQGEGEGSEKKKGLSTISKGIYALQSTYVINQSIYVKDIHINLSEIVTKLMNNEILKQYSFELTEALSSNFVPFDPSSNIFLHLKKIKEKEEEKEKAQLAELRELEKEKRKEEEKVNSVPTVRKLFPLEDNTEAKEDDNEQSDAQSVSSHNSHGSNSSHASSSSQRKAKKSRKKSKKGSIERDSTHLIREALETDQENKVDINSGIESDLNQEDLTTKRVMKKRRPTMDVMKRKTGKNKRRGSNNTDDSEIGEGDEEEVERGTIATVEERSEASGKSHKSKKSIKSSRSKQSHRSNRSTRSVKSSLTTISQKKEFKDIYDLMYNDTKHEDELKSVITGATSALPSRHNHGVESIQEESHSSHRAASDRGLDKNHRTVNWRHFYHQKSREYHSQIGQSKDHDQLINVLESL